MNRSTRTAQETVLDSSKAEEERIRAAYAKRQRDARYSMFSPSHLFTIHELERHLILLLKRYGFSSLDTKKILEIGCGTGFWLRELVQWGAKPESIFGIDLLPNRVAEAKQLCPSTMSLECQSAADLPFPDSSFDLVFQATVFTSILDSRIKQEVASEMLRVVKREGLILWYDYHINNPHNSDVRAIKKQEIYRLFPGCNIDLEATTLAPPLARFLAPYSRLACYLLQKIPWLCTHYLGVIRKPDISSKPVSEEH